MLDWLGQHWLQAVGVIVSAGALFFAWRICLRSRSFVTAEIQPTTTTESHRGGEQQIKLTLPVVFRPRRNDAHIADTWLIVGKERVSGSTVMGPKAVNLRLGGNAHRYWYADQVRHLNPRKPWRIYWQDSEGRLHRAARSRERPPNGSPRTARIRPCATPA